ncbi:hypothetical protein [Streptomyces griseus]|uniref:hypothetical protein n=1 Tax=Streptomyces griseus TaxID=1911 RepID=UPI00055DB91E|nr:hypothetical protein [Streptomyces griseus]
MVRRARRPAAARRGALHAGVADIRARSTDGANPAWTARTAHEWEYCFAAQAHEARGRTCSDCRAAPGEKCV